MVYELKSTEKDFILSCGGRMLPAVFHDKLERKEREKKVKEHAEADDYFGTLATVIDLMLQEKMRMEKSHNKIIEDIKNDLLFLQKEHRIGKK